ncbi:MAG TPA: CHC2 zinc finger domain-containing protein [Stellaceae bacterium]|nr:CHC2 zinc finger domain-containing protein [Stellaceae bacterium]
MPHYRIDFRTLKRKASFQIVLDRYGLTRHGAGRRHFILCPFHRETEPSCLIDHSRNRFRCFGCGESGSILDFVAKLENCTITAAAAIVADWCKVANDGGEAASPREAGSKEPGRCGTGGIGSGDEDAVNQPLRYRLRLDPSHPYLAERGLAPDIIERFGLGFCDCGVMSGRIAIPIHDEAGRLIAYAGRWAAAEVPRGRPRYLLPRGFHKQRVLFNLHRVAGARELLIVESYWSVFRLSTLGVPAVALMGRDLSAAQLALLVAGGADRVKIMLDGDAPGRSATVTMVPHLARHAFVKSLELPDAMKPHSAAEEVLRRLIGLP